MHRAFVFNALGILQRLGELAKEKARAVEADRTQRLREAEAARRLSEIEDRLQTAQGSLREANRRVTLLERELASTKSDLAEAQLGLKANTEARTQAKEHVAKMGEEIVQLRTLASQRQDQLDALAASRLGKFCHFLSLHSFASFLLMSIL